MLRTGILIVGEACRSSSIKLAVIVFFIAVGTSSSRYGQLVSVYAGSDSGVGAAAAIVFFAYIGFERRLRETQNPQRDLPIGIFPSLGVCTFALCVAAVLRHRPGAVFSHRHPCTGGRRTARSRLQVGAAIVAVGAVAGITSVLVARCWGQGTRPCFSPRWPARSLAVSHTTEISHAAPCHLPHRHSRGHHGGLSPISEAADMTNMGTSSLPSSSSVGSSCSSVYQPNHPRPFRMPLVHARVGRPCLPGLDVFLP